MNTAPNYIFSALDSSLHWDKDIVTFSIPVVGSQWSYEGDPSSGNYATFNQQQAEQFRKAINTWDELIALDFIEVTEPNTIGDIRIAFSDDTYAKGAAGWANYPGEYDQAGDIWVHSSKINETFQKETHLYGTLIHEIGHALGFRHPFTKVTNTENNLPVYFTTQDDNNNEIKHHLPQNEENRLYTVMSYTGTQRYKTMEFYINNDNKLAYYIDDILPETPMLYDIAVAQQIYGIETNTRAENTTYQWNTDEKFIMTLWDSAGNDTIDVSNQTGSNIINLEGGTFSSINKMNIDDFINETINKYPTYPEVWIRERIEGKQDNLYTGENNLAIAFGAVIENAIGGKNNDTLLGNEVDNQLTGNAGDDFLNGRDGFDTAIFSGVFSQCRIEFSQLPNNQQLKITDQIGSDGVDILENIEQLQFTDKVVSIAELKNPTQVPTHSNEVITQPLEGDSNHINYFLIESSNVLSAPVSFHYQTENGSAIAGEDYIQTSGTVTMQAGESSVAIGVEIIGDNIKENNETFYLQITSAATSTNLQAMHTIIDDDTSNRNQRQSAEIINTSESGLSMSLIGLDEYNINNEII